MRPQSEFAARLPRGACVLDVGCGDFGRIHRYVAGRRRDLSVTGLERFAGATIYGPSNPVSAADSARFVRLACNIESERFPFDDNCFDGGYLCHVIEHVQHKERVLEEIRRVLRPGGVLYVETPGPRASRAHRPRWAPPTLGGTINYRDDPTHLGEPQTLASLQELLRTSGFAVLRSGAFRELGLAGMPLYLLMAGAGLAPVLPMSTRSFLYGAGYRNLLGWAIFALAEKPAA